MASGFHHRDIGCAICAEQRQYDPPYEYRTGKYNKCIFKPDYITKAKDSRPSVAAEHELCLGSNSLSPRIGGSGHCLCPPAECGHNIVINAAYERSHHKQLGLAAAGRTLRLAAHQHLCSGRSFRERVLSVHVLYEITAEWYEEKYAQHTAEQ